MSIAPKPADARRTDEHWPPKSEAGADPHELCARFFHIGQRVHLRGDAKIVMIVEVLDVKEDALVHVIWRSKRDILRDAFDPRCLAVVNDD